MVKALFDADIFGCLICFLVMLKLSTSWPDRSRRVDAAPSDGDKSRWWKSDPGEKE
jgi:hypothetical protein